MFLHKLKLRLQGLFVFQPDAAEYTMKVSSDALGMSSAEAKVSEAGAKITWDEDTKQDFATWE